MNVNISLGEGIHQLLVWGANGSGQLGLGHNRENEANSPIPLKLDYLNVCNIKSIFAGGSHTILLHEDGSLIVCGNNCKYQLGMIDSPSINSFRLLRTGIKIAKISCGWEHNVAITEDGDVFSWGGNNYHQLGINTKHNGIHIPQRVDISKNCQNRKIIDVSAGLRHSVALTEEKEIFSWGSNGKGQLGFCDRKEETIPREVTSLGKKNIKQISAGAFCTAALSSESEIYLWGCNKKGQLLTDPETLQNSFVPQKRTICTANVSYIRTGWSHVLAVTGDGDIFSWGRNDYGQLGRKSDGAFDWDAKIIEGLRSPKILRVGAEHNVAVINKNDGSDAVYTWGWNEHGICGNGREENIELPTSIELNSDVVRIRQLGVGCGQNLVITQKLKLSDVG